MQFGIYNRLRFAYLKFFTKTTIFYLIFGIGLALIMRLSGASATFTAVGIALAVAVFFRSLGNPLAKDMEKPYLVSIPSSAHEKVFWSLMSGTLDALLDTFPTLVFAGIVLSASPAEILLYWFLCIAVDFYSNNVMLFIELSLPTSLSNQLKQMVVVMFIYFGLVPVLVVGLIGFFLSASWMLSAFLASLAALMVGLLFFAFSPIFLEKGRK